MTSRRLILDCDPGIDDAVAIAVALAHTDVVGICTVGGNVGVTQTTTNALALCDLLGAASTPVHSGADLPLDGRLDHRATEFHGRSGTGSARLPAPSRPPTSTDAVSWLIDTVRAEEGLWLVATGPLTNAAAALSRAPDLVGRLAGISWMGGSSRGGDTTAAAEFNSWVDPQAARIVFGAGHPDLTMVGLNVTERVLLDRIWIGELALATAGTPTEIYAEMLADYEARQRLVTNFAGAAIHDVLAVLRVSHPWLLAGLRRHVEVVVEPGPARGMTVVDERALRRPHAANATVIDWVDADGVRAIVAGALTRPNGPPYVP
jgi:inosine-uridine nucleoside N-ribohydrolase